MRACVWSFVLLAASPGLLGAQEAGGPVIIDGQEVVRVYGPAGLFNARERAPEIERRIISLAEKGFSGRLATRNLPSDKAILVLAGGVVVMGVTQVDAETAGVPQDQLARQYADAIQKAIEGYRERHTWRSLMTGTGKALLAWALFTLSAWVLWRIISWLSVLIKDHFRRRTATGAAGISLLVERGTLLLMLIVKLVAGFAMLSACSFLLSYTFGLFPATAGISTTLWDYLRHTFGTAAMAILDYLPSGGFVVLVIVAAHYALKVLKFLATAIERGDLSVPGIHPEMAKPTYQLARLIVIIFAVIVGFPYLPGGKTEAFKGISIFVGLLLSLGSSSSVSNVLAGLVLTYMRPYRSGDRVKIADTIGDVLEKTLLVTRVRTIKNVEVVIPNAAILGNQILNYSALARTKGLILHTTVTIGYDAPWRTVHELLINAALGTDGILRDPAPFVLQTSLNDFHISYELNAYTDRANEIQDIYSYLHQAIQDSFNRAGVEIMSPTFYALRDGNTVTIPASDRPADYEAPSFRVKETTVKLAEARRAGQS